MLTFSFLIAQQIYWIFGVRPLSKFINDDCPQSLPVGGKSFNVRGYVRGAMSVVGGMRIAVMCENSAAVFCVWPKPVFKLLMVQLTVPSEFMPRTQVFAVWVCRVYIMLTGKHGGSDVRVAPSLSVPQTVILRMHASLCRSVRAGLGRRGMGQVGILSRAPMF